ncbi:MAG TPA: methylated-DNA--[protein]-cysteine S-methyltransferase [Candidatus Aminicenantes bacterium]|nr:methylated-DNA--[protein]-cysteine S-methyltransferase [Candidatus Aminicenantes bacterium]HRY64226.1 methylated-DNA--[protein]-cysteine S-methyltransferase [Candidatus Aminicenantes bacterium]HRZ71139.1 methylated-DNA--[protein]-cysteine S-methyltransferase [Candidatus Aminicenantes bacterium]
MSESEPVAFRAYYESPIGTIEIIGADAGVSGLNFVDIKEEKTARRLGGRPPVPVADALAQLDGYFRGDRRAFTVKLDLRGTDFQRMVWSRLLLIEYGRTTTYGALAAAVGRPAATRAVGGANHSNPVSIIVPCHRVVGSDGRLTGYGGGLWRKEWLLRHEGRDGLFV